MEIGKRERRREWLWILCPFNKFIVKSLFWQAEKSLRKREKKKIISIESFDNRKLRIPKYYLTFNPKVVQIQGCLILIFVITNIVNARFGKIAIHKTKTHTDTLLSRR